MRTTPKKQRGIENLKSKYGRRFVLIWEIGIVIFVLIPMIQSIIYSFSNVTATDFGLETVFCGLKNFKYIFNEDPKYLTLVAESLKEIIYSLPAIVVISMIIGIILNNEFKGRLFFRALYFLPVIISTGVVIEWINECTNPTLTNAGVGNTASDMLNVSDVLSLMGLKGGFVEYFQSAISEIFNFVWASGIQIVLVISGLQSIPDTFYEVSKVEGATKWEEFWFITFPMLSRTTVLIIIFTMVELLISKTNVVMSYIYLLMSTLNYSESSAMIWVYLLISGTLMGLVVLLFNKLCIKKWE